MPPASSLTACPPSRPKPFLPGPRAGCDAQWVCVPAELWGERLRRTDGPRSWGVSWEKPSKGDGPGDTACAGSRGSSPDAGHSGSMPHHHGKGAVKRLEPQGVGHVASSDLGHWQLIALTVQQGWPGPAPSPRALRTPTTSTCLLLVARAGT